MKQMYKILVVSVLVALLFVPGMLFAADSIKILAPRSTSSLPLLQLAVDDPLPGIDNVFQNKRMNIEYLSNLCHDLGIGNAGHIDPGIG